MQRFMQGVKVLFCLRCSVEASVLPSTILKSGLYLQMTGTGTYLATRDLLLEIRTFLSTMPKLATDR